MCYEGRIQTKKQLVRYSREFADSGKVINKLYCSKSGQRSQTVVLCVGAFIIFNTVKRTETYIKPTHTHTRTHARTHARNKPTNKQLQQQQQQQQQHHLKTHFIINAIKKNK